MKPELRENLEDALKHGREIQRFVSGMSLEHYSSDEKTRLAVERFSRSSVKRLIAPINWILS
jgi:uncharacterized protein with HEPN domain